MEETATSTATPEQLLHALEVQLAQQRSRSGKTRTNRVAILVAAILFILVAAGGALVFLAQILEERRNENRAGRPDAIAAEKRNF